MRSVLVAFLALTLCLAGGPAWANLELDASFSHNGVANVRFERWSLLFSAAVMSDSRIVVVGNVAFRPPRLALARLLPDGTLDGTFSRNGKRTVASGAPRFLSALQPDGGIVLAGGSSLMRVLPDGHVDRTFDGAVDLYPISDIAIQPDGRILVAAAAPIPRTGISVARLLPDGGLDPDFGDGGIATIYVAANAVHAGEIAVLPDGHIAVAGTAAFGEFEFDSSPMVVQFTRRGRVDEAFGRAGVAMHEPGTGERLLSLAVQPNGKLVLAGATFSDFESDDLMLMRIRPSGRLDPTFGNGGVVTVSSPTSDSSRGVAISGGEIVVVGQAFIDTGGQWLAAQFNRGGDQIDRFVGLNGRAENVAVDPLGRFVIAGSADFTEGSRFTVARFLP